MASISRNGVAVSNNEIQLFPSQSQEILLKVPPDNSGGGQGNRNRYNLIDCVRKKKLLCALKKGTIVLHFTAPGPSSNS